MRDLLTRLGRSSALYGMGTAIQRVLQLILLPVYTRYLSPEDYGVYALLNANGNFVRPLVWLGMGQALIWAVVYRNRDEAKAFSSALCFMMGQGFLLLGVLSIFASPIAGWSLGDAAHAPLLRLMWLTVWMESVEVLFVVHTRIHERAMLFMRVMICRFLTGASLSVLFLVPLGRGVTGLMEATVITSALFSALSLYLMRPMLRPRVDRAQLMELLRFGLPLAPAALAGMVLMISDRFFLLAYRSQAEVGLYALGYHVGMLMNLLVQAVQMGWLPQMYHLAKQSDAVDQFRRLLTYYVLVLGFCVLGVSLLAGEALEVMTTPEYAGAAAVVPMVALSYLFMGVGLMTNVGVNTQNKTLWTTAVVVVAALVNLALNAWWIPRWGMLGAAWATLASYTLQLLLQLGTNQRLWPIRYEYGRLFRIAVAGLVLFLLGGLIPDSTPLAVALALKLALLGLFPVVLAGLGMWRPGERALMMRLLFRRKTG